MRKKHLLIFILCLLGSEFYAQTQISGIINHYTAVYDIDYCGSILTVTNPEEFEPGQQVLLIQMQGATINESNSSAFGTINDMNSAGLYERTSIVNKIANQIYLEHLLVNTYDDNFGSLQLVSVPVYTDAHVTGTVYPQPWNGLWGGVLAMEVEGTLTLDAPIDASGRGFRGGDAASIEPNNCSWLLPQNDYYYDYNNWRGAEKGEGIAQMIYDKEAGRGAQANGGGGANDHNSGGGGGANLTAGGVGGENDEPSTFGCNGFFPGRGGKAISNGNNRLFMGGGGGAGHMNNDAGSDGGNGGGIIFIKATTIDGPQAILNVAGIEPPLTEGADGGGGGGAGGTIHLDLIENASPLTFDFRGGSGGSVDNGNQVRCMGPGGGGSGGVVSTSLVVGIDVIFDIGPGGAGLTLNTPESCNNSTMGAASGEPGIVTAWTGIVAGTEVVQQTAILEQPSDTTVCEGASLDWVVNAAGNGLIYQWQVDEGSGFVDLMDDLTYSGTQTAQLSIDNVSLAQNDFVYRCMVGSNCFATLTSDEIVLNVVAAPVADFEFIVDGNMVTFTNTSQNNDPLYNWNFGDNNTSTDLNPVHEYMAGGTYLVSLIVGNACAMDTIVQEVIVGELPVANFEADGAEGCAPLTVQFTDLSEGAVDSWSWTFPGGTPASSQEQNPLVVYNNAGLYEVSLAVTNAIGSQSVTYVDFVNVVPEPVPDFSFEANDLMVDFTNLSLFADTYQWDFGDGSGLNFDENPIHEYALPGVYEVTLTAGNEFCESAISITVEVFMTSVKEWKLAGVEIYPVPAGDWLEVEMEDPANEQMLDIFDSKGSLVERLDLKGTLKMKLNTSSWQPGAYVFVLKNKKGVFLRKIIKQ